MYVNQSRARPNRVLNSIIANFGPNTQAIQIAVAYVTMQGARTLIPAMAHTVGERWEDLSKTLITCFDFGYTEPAALSYLQGQGMEVYVANLGGTTSTQLASNLASFHPKVYISVLNEGGSAIIGSANLSRRALTINTEVMVRVETRDTTLLTDLWKELMSTVVPLTDSLLERYQRTRERARPLRLQDEPTAPSRVDRLHCPNLRDSVESGRIQPLQFHALWIETGYVSGGSRNQLELPRLSHTFFGYEFSSYSAQQQEIGRPTLIVGERTWNDRKLTWHGNNRMERINLPPPNQSGLNYRNQVILFQRGAHGYDLTVAPLAGSTAERWRSESAAAKTLFRVSSRSPRLCGLI